METKVYETGDMIRVLEIKADASDLESDTRLATQNLKTHSRLQGFRPGHAPTKLIRKLFRKELEKIIVDGLINEVIKDKVADNNEYKVISNPSEITREYELDGDLLVRLEFFVLPQLTLKDFRGQPLDIPVYNVTDELIDRYIKNLFAIHLTPRPLAFNERVGMNSEGKFDLVKFQLIEVDSKTHQVVVGGDMIEEGIFNFGATDEHRAPEFDYYQSKLTGKFVGDVFFIEIPENSPKSLENNNDPQSYYRIKIIEAYRFDWPEIDDLWASKLSNNVVQSAEEFHQWVANKLNDNYNTLSRNAAYAKIKKSLLKLHPFSLPSNLLDALDIDDHIVEEVNKNEEYKKILFQNYEWNYFVDAVREQLEEFLTTHSPDSQPVTIPEIRATVDEENLMLYLMHHFEKKYCDVLPVPFFSDYSNKELAVQTKPNLYLS
ncbi:MAG: trigger factor [Bacteroidetes bacterium]|nr:trigger factor [Bacteroidota bacterium]MCY4232243.1 trigger factor [Bacteroidota bacterium]